MEVSPELNLVQHYIQAFYDLCVEIGGETAEAMCPLLEFEADRRCFLITINSFNTELTKDLREKLYPTCGKLYPEGLTMLNACEDFEQVLLENLIHLSQLLLQVRQVAEMFGEYRPLFDGVGTGPGDKTLEDKLYEYEVLQPNFHFYVDFR